MRTHDITADELAAAKANGRARLAFADNASEVRFLAHAFATGGAPTAAEEARTALEAVTVEDVRRVANTYLTEHPTVTLVGDFRQTWRSLKSIGRVTYLERK